MPLAAGDVVAGYTVVRQLGAGGMGAVYLVRHPRLPRLDALKLLRPEYSADPDFSRRFLHEADVVAGLSHRNVVPVLDRGEEHGQLWLTMRYIDGIDAERALDDAGGLLPAERVAHIVTEVAAALDAAHRRHVVHRDVKPANILLAPAADDDEPEQVFLTDFGIAKSLDGSGTRLTRTGAVLATFDYAAPEQIESRAPDPRSDVYSLACVLHRLLTGSVPYPGAGVASAIHGHLQLPPPRPTVSVPWLAPGIDEVIARGMAKDPATRYATCRALAAAAAEALADFPPPPRPPYTVRLTGPGGAVLGPVTTDRLTAEETARLVDLVRRTRFFDLPEELHEVAGRTTTGHRPRGGRPVAVEIRAGRSVHRVVADLDEARRPAVLDALVEAVEHLRPTGAAPQPATILNDLRAAHAVMAAPASPAVPATSPPGPSPPGTSPPGTSPPGTSPPGTSPPPGRAAAPLPTSPSSAEPPPARVPPPRSTGPRGPSSSAVGASPVAAGPGADAPDRRPRRGRRWLGAALAGVLAGAAAATVWTLVDDGRPPREDPGTAGTSSPQASSVGEGTSPAQLALERLPRAPALDEDVLVAPLDVDGNVDLYLVDAATGTRTARLTDAAGRDFGPVVAPDRATVVYLRETGEGNEIRVLGADGGGDRPLFARPPADCPLPMRPAWDPEQPTRLAIVCHSGTGPASLRLVTLDGTVVRELATGLEMVDDLTFSSDGTTVAYWGGARGDGAGDLYAQPVDGSAGPRRLTGTGADNDAVWSPDGERIAFARTVAEGVREIHVMDADGSDARPLTSDGSVNQGPSWSPDGSRVAYKSNRPSADGVRGDHLWVVGLEDEAARELEAGGLVFSSPTWGHR